MILLIDNYDSFTWNLVQCMGILAPDERPSRWYAMIRIGASRGLERDGPVVPRDLAWSMYSKGNRFACPDLIRAFAGRIPMLGVCLGPPGHRRCPRDDRPVGMMSPMHGKTSRHPP